MNGESINKVQEAERFNVHPRSIQRDIEDLRIFLENLTADGYARSEIVYDKSENCYYMRHDSESKLTESEIFAVCKILLESRSLNNDEIKKIITKLLDLCTESKEQSLVKSLISNEMHYYVEPRHQKKIIDNIWDIGKAVKEQHMIKIIYAKQDNSIVERVVKPVGIMFSEYYFYLTAFIEGVDKKTEYHNPDDIFPTIYRIDRIQKYEILNEYFDIPYSERFSEGEFRKRIQFMYGGKLKRIKFRYTGKNVEAVLDRLPTAKIIESDDNGYIINAEVFGDGIDMWLRSQGDNIKVLK